MYQGVFFSFFVAGPVYSNGTVSVDSKTGEYFFNTTDFVNPPVGNWGFYARRCKLDESFYFPENGTCTQNDPLPGQCLCLEDNANASDCLLWAPSISPSEIPTSATLQGNSTVNGYPHVQVRFCCVDHCGYFPHFFYPLRTINISFT